MAKKDEILSEITESFPVGDLSYFMHNISEDIDSLKPAYEELEDDEMLVDIYDMHSEILKQIIIDNINKIIT